MIVTGCGTSKYAGELGAKIMRDLDCFDNVYVIDSAEVRAADLPRQVRHSSKIPHSLAWS